MLKNQTNFPLTYVDTFVSCNPIALKAEILRNFVYCPFVSDRYITLTANKPEKWAEELHSFVLASPFIQEIEKRFLTLTVDFALKKHFSWIPGWHANTKTKMFLLKEPFVQSIQFYFFLVILGEKIQENRTFIITSNGFKKEKLSKQLFDYFNRLAKHVGKVWHIYDASSLSLVADYLQQIFCRVDFSDFCQHHYEMLYYHYLKTSVDMANIVKSYINNNMYARICSSRRREQKNGEMLFD